MIGVVILNYFSAAETRRLYARLCGNPDLRLLVVDNSCDAAEAVVLREGIAENDLLFSASNRGYAGGNNLGISRLLEDSGREVPELIALLNPDIVPGENVFTALQEAFDRNPRLGAAGPRLCIRGLEETIYSDGGVLGRGEGGYLQPGHLNAGRTVGEADPEEQAKIDYVNGSFLMIRSETFREVGHFSERFFLYFEETDWCLRAVKLGWELDVVREACAWQRISKKQTHYLYHYYRSWLLFLHLYDKPGVRRLAADQLRRVKWVLQEGGLPIAERLRRASRRLGGVIMGYLNL